MSTIFDDDENLPGVITRVESDYSFGYDTSQFGTTDSVVIIGTAFNGPVGQPVEIYSPEHAKYIFGNVYDSARRKETTLVAGIVDAWKRGCRTIYGVRVSGKDVYKDFALNVDCGLKLRVSSMFPSNVAKNVYVRYDATVGDEKLILYKPASRATISQKKRGEVTSSSAVLKTELHLAQDLGYSRNTNLVDIIRYFNNYDDNNVVKLSIVDNDGNDVTDSEAAYSLPLGTVFPGVYFIGRDQNTEACPETTKTKIVLTENAAVTPYSHFDKAFFRKLEINTDVATQYPIYFDSAHKAAFKKAISQADILMTKDWDFIEVAGAADKAFALDKIDYEEVSLSTFDVYKRLGCGYAIAAKAERRVDANGNEVTPRVKEAPMDDVNRVQPITDGIYAVLNDAEIDYRVLTNVYADDKISSKLPRAREFRQASAQSATVLNGFIEIVPKIASDDMENTKSYSFKFKAVDNMHIDEASSIKIDEIFEVVDELPSDKAIVDVQKTVEAGTTLLVSDGTGTTFDLVRITTTGHDNLNTDDYVGVHVINGDKVFVGKKEGSAVKFSEDAEFAQGIDSKGNPVSYQYVVGESFDNVSVFKVNGATVSPVGDLETLLKNPDEADKDTTIIATATSLPFSANNEVIVSSSVFGDMTVEELVEAMNNHSFIGKLFEVRLTEDGSEVKTDMVADVCADDLFTAEKEGKVVRLLEDRKVGYNYNLYIPYRTTDNFARQLAQHCIYTELRTSPTHGVIGCNRQTDTSLSAIAKRVADLRSRNFDLYAKNNYGQNMLDKNSYPYPIGRNLSITFLQHYVNIDDENYTYLAVGAPAYAGMVSCLPLDQAPTCQHINIGDETFNLTTSQRLALTAAGIVTARESFSKGIVITDGITCAPADSHFRRLSTTRIINSVEDLIRICAEPYIGKQNNYANRNSLQTAINRQLNQLLDTLITKFKFSLNTDANAMQLSYIDITYQIVPINEIREIRNTISVKDEID